MLCATLESTISTALEPAGLKHSESSCPTLDVDNFTLASQPSTTNLLPTFTLLNSMASVTPPALKSATLNSLVTVMSVAVPGNVLNMFMSGTVIVSNTESVPTLPGTLVTAPQYGLMSNL